MARARHFHHWLPLIALGLFLSVWLGYACAQDASFTQPGRVTPVKSPAKARIVPGPEILVSRNEDFAHVETMLAANPADPRHLLASCIILPKDNNNQFLFRTRAYVSRDAGKTWKASPLTDENLWDPVIAFTPRGTTVFVSLPPPRNLSVFRSQDGGATWKDRTDLPFTDGPMIAVDWTARERRGRIYITGRRGEERTDPIVVHHSADEGRSFETSVAVTEAIAGRALNPLVLQDGTLFLPFSGVAGARLEQIDGLRSSDGGRTFSHPFRIATRQKNTKDAADTPPAVFAAGLHARKERLYGVYAVYRANGNARLVLTRSDNGGRTWSDAREIARGPSDGVTHGAANVSVNRSGVVGISWLQRKIGPIQQENDKDCQKFTCFNETYDLFFTASLDGGDTFLAPLKITSRSSAPLSKHASRFLPGSDYMLTEAAGDGTFHLLWPDARNGIFQLYASAVRVE